MVLIKFKPLEIRAIVEKALITKGVSAFVDTSDPMIIIPNIDTVIQGITAAGQHYHVFRAPDWGTVLAINGKVQSTSYDQEFYHKCLMEPLFVGDMCVETVLIVGAGELASVSLATLMEGAVVIHAVDIDRELVMVAMAHLESFHKNRYTDARVSFFYEDAVQFLKEAPTAYYDRIAIDVNEPLENSLAVPVFKPSTLGEIKRVMRSDGILAVQAGPWDHFLWRSIGATLEAMGFIYRVSFHYIPSFFTKWAFIHASPDPLILDEIKPVEPFAPPQDSEAPELGEKFRGFPPDSI